jgi:ubiquinone/menaquinone biosynthesis C-methylase UbiE
VKPRKARALPPGLEAGLDENTKARLSAMGMAAGWRCLELGAGSGSIARWMAERVGARGYVLATDIDTRWIQSNGLSQLDVQRHDIVADLLPPGEFDVVHARLVLSWLPARDAVLSRLVAALKPGGWLAVEDFDTVLHRCLDPLNDDERVFDKVSDAFGQALHRRGVDTTWPRTLPHRLAAAGLVDVGAAGHLTIFHGRSPAAQLWIANIDQVGNGLIQAGLITAAERDIFLCLMIRPSSATTRSSSPPGGRGPIRRAERSHPPRPTGGTRSERLGSQPSDPAGARLTASHAE